MINWYWLIVALGVTIPLWYFMWRFHKERDKAIWTCQMLEMEYRLMSQNTAMYAKLEEFHQGVVKKMDEGFTNNG